MKFFITFLSACLFMVSSVAHAQESIMKKLPVPTTVSDEMRLLIVAGPFPFWNVHPKNAGEWKAFVRSVSDGSVKALPMLRESMGVTVKAEKMGGVRVFVITPKDIPAKNKDRVLLHFHGGGYVLDPGEAGTAEAIIAAGNTRMKVISVDYRMPPDSPYPAAMDDAIAVYAHLLKTKTPDKIGVFGTSTGGGMTLALIHRAKKDGLALPAAIMAGTPWSDLTKTGDSYFVNEWIDNMLVTYDGWLGDAAKLYAGKHDMKDPMLSPVYGDMKGFPPAMLVTGTRDLFLSNTVRVHTKLREADVTADLLVFEGASHMQYMMAPPSAPEAKLYYSEFGKFFDKYLK